MQQQLIGYQKFFLASNIHETETEVPLTFDKTTNWQVPIFQDSNPQQVFMKCSQVGVTVIAIVNMMTLLQAGMPGLYVLPTGVTMYDFVKNRIDPILSNVDYYADHYGGNREDVKGARMKTIFGRRVKFAGSNVQNSFFEMPAEWYIIDEIDRCDAINLDYLEDRISRAKTKYRIKIGNPTFDKMGIHAEYLASNMQEWLIRCPHCNKHQMLDWFENVVRQVGRRTYVLRDRNVQRQINDLVKIEGPEVGLKILADRFEKEGKDARVYCSAPKCQKVIDRHAPGEWIAKALGRTVSGYHINKIFGDPNAGAVLNVFNKQQGSLHDPDKKQRWYNNDLGIPYEEKGSRITDQLLSDACREYTMPRALPQQFFQQDIEWSVMGIDVGSQFHVTISGMWMHRFNVYRIKLYVGNVSEIEDVEKLIKRFNVTSAVIDAFPEQRLARALCKKYSGFYMCEYNKSDKIQADHVRDDKTRRLQLNRTEALDMSLAEYDAGLVLLPLNWRHIDGGEFRTQMKMPTRVYDPILKRVRWTKGKDHYRHADTYELWATKLPGAARWGGMKGSF